ncbi:MULTISPECIES: hypothetical protein [Bacillota]|uniref:hypothetical protein n=1 Tax=Bacillota TaxID=1239 RepID=UPI0039EDFB82
MKKYYVILPDGRVDFSGQAEILHEYLEDKFEALHGFRPMFQESEDEGYLEMYLHTDSFDILSDEELCSLDRLGITESDSLNNLMLLLNIRVELWDEDEIASCSLCNNTYHEVLVNVVDFEDDVCKNCLPGVKSALTFA